MVVLEHGKLIRSNNGNGVRTVDPLSRREERGGAAGWLLPENAIGDVVTWPAVNNSHIRRPESPRLSWCWR